MGCGCGKGTQVKYEVTFTDQSKPPQTAESISEAQAIITRSGVGPGQATFKAVPA